jgi:murein L,D-transpeptidase YcbB/YkuD
MLGIRASRLLASTSVVLLLAAAPGGVFAAPMTDQEISAAVPMPEPANVPPPTTADFAAPAASPAGPAPAASPAATPAQTADKPAASAPAADAPAPAAQPANATAEPAANPAAAANAPSGPDAPIADQLRELTNGKFDRVIANKQTRTTIDAFYSGRSYAPIWITDGKANARAKSAIAYLGHVDADGLEPSDYPVPNFEAASDPVALADAEIKLTMSVLTYARHASIGRVAWSRVSPDILFTETAPDPADVLAAVVGASEVGPALDVYEPKTPGYLALKAKLAEVRAGKTEKGKAPIANGPVLKIGMQDDRVPELRDRLGATGDGDTTYDKALAEAVKKFQQSHKIAVTGTLTAPTLEALNGKAPDHQADIIIANLERWRWMPHKFPDTYVIVNLPDFTLRVIHDGQQLWTTRIVDGKPEMPTPIMTAEMKYITINPTWNVPPSIVNHEYLPALQQDPTVLDRMGLKVTHNPDGTIHIYQPPGDKNALGRIRFNFPNKFLVYQHDTPDKYMFAYDKRAFSHGCMRVQDPQHYAEVLLSLVRPGEGYNEDRIRKMIASNAETDIQFPTFIPVDLTYQTAFVDDAGKLQFREDIYGRDRALLAILKGDRKDADVPVEHREDPSHREVLAMPDQSSLFGGRGMFGGGRYYPGGGGDNFFSRLFGGFGSEPAPVPRRAVTHSRKVTQRSTVTR